MKAGRVAAREEVKGGAVGAGERRRVVVWWCGREEEDGGRRGWEILERPGKGKKEKEGD